MNRTLSFTVNGEPKPAGSKRAVMRGNKVRVIDANPDSREWKNLVTDAAIQAMRAAQRVNPDTGEIIPFNGPLAVSCTLYRARPKTHHTPSGSLTKTGNRTPYPITRPDATKLWRGTEDACTGIVWVDDSQIVMQRISKRWGTPRAEIIVDPILSPNDDG